MDPKQLTRDLAEKLGVFDYQGVNLLCQGLTEWLFGTGDSFPLKEGERILQALRNKRLFSLMQKVGDAFIQTGRVNHKIKRLYVQSLIDQDILSASITMLQGVLSETEAGRLTDKSAADENIEARGILGRVYKQLYLKSTNPESQTSQEHLKQALHFYFNVYISEPRQFLWHGINVVALLARSARDKVIIHGYPDPGEISIGILDAVEEMDRDGRASMYDFATAGEASIALGRKDEALRWLMRYVNAPYADAFEIGGTLRQFTEVWELDKDQDIGKLAIPLLQAKLLEREGGQVTIDPNALLQIKKEEQTTSAAYEKVFGEDSFESYRWYMQGAERCLAIARIGRDSSKGLGTGFLMNLKDLNPKMGNELVLLTNSHVLSNEADVSGSLSQEEAVVIFEAIDPKQEFRIGAILWSSPPSRLDATIARFIPEDTDRLRLITKDVKPYSIAKNLPATDEPQRVYIIGHPAGGTLCLSLQDNLLIDHQSPLIHYRTPTVGGSSGSPVFNRNWQLIGVHHSGGNELPRLNGAPGVYEANEGIWIQAIINALSTETK